MTNSWEALTAPIATTLGILGGGGIIGLLGWRRDLYDKRLSLESLATVRALRDDEANSDEERAVWEQMVRRDNLLRMKHHASMQDGKTYWLRLSAVAVAFVLIPGAFLTVAYDPQFETIPYWLYAATLGLGGLYVLFILGFRPTRQESIGQQMRDHQKDLDRAIERYAAKIKQESGSATSGSEGRVSR